MRHALPYTALALLGTLACPIRADAQDWPMARRDRTRTALQSLPADIDVPAVKYTIPLGGAPSEWLVDDVDLDGQAEVVLLRGGRAVARRFDGTLVWASAAFGLNSLRAITDFDRDGRPEVFAGSSLQGLFVLDGRSGAVIWRPDWSPEQRLGDVFPLDADGNGRLELYVTECRPGGNGTGRIYAFEAGAAVPTSHVELDLSGHGYWCGRQQAAGDLDGDGLPEIVTLSDDRVIAYDPRSGEPRWTSAPLGRFPYARGSVTARDLDGDGRAEIVITSNDGTAGVDTSKRILLLALEAGEIGVRWSRVFDPTGGLHAYAPNPIGDIVPGGGLEIVTSAYEPGVGWRLMIVAGDATEGAEPVIELSGRRLVGLVDVTGDDSLEIITVDASAPSITAFGTLRALSLETGSPPTVDELWRHDDASLALEPTAFGGAPAAVSLGTDGVVLRRDTDGDGRADEVLGSTTDAPSRSPSAAAGNARSLEAGLAVALVDGHVEHLGVDLSLENATAEGLPSLREPSYSVPGLVVGGGDSGPTLVTVDGSAALVGFSATSDGVAREWRRAEVVTGGGPAPPSFTWLADGTLTFHARRAGGALDLLRVEGSSGATASTAVRLADSSLLGPLGAPFPLDGRVLQATYDSQTATIDYQLIDMATGDSADTELDRPLSGSFDRPPTAYGDDVIVPQGARLTIADGTSGAVLSQTVVSRPGGIVHVADLDEDGTDDVLYGGGFGLQHLDADLAEVWSFDVLQRHTFPAIASTPAGVRAAAAKVESPSLSIVRGTDGTLVAQQVLAGGGTFTTVEAAEASGAVVGALTDVIALSDLDGEGTAAFVVGSTDGHLYAVAADDGRLLWSLTLRSAMGAPIAADFDGDGASDILVPASDGSVYVVGRAELEAPETVFDTDGTFVASGPDEDLDVLDSATRVGANWMSVPGATGYSYQIVREDDLVVVPWTDVGGETRFAWTDLALQAGRRYFTLCRAHDDSGARPRVSTEASSDGFVVADAAPPEVEVTADPSAIGRPGTSMIRATYRDDVGLDSYRLLVTDADGTDVVELAAGLTGGTERVVEEPWDGTDSDDEPVTGGRYTVVAEATDAEGRTGRATTTVTICADEAADLPECALEPDGGMAASDAGVPAGPWQVEGGGCRCDATVGGGALGSALPLLFVLGGLMWARSRRGRAQQDR